MSAPSPGPPGPRPGPPSAGPRPAAPHAATGPDAADVSDHALVQDVRERLAALRERPVDEHVAAYDDVHRRLQDALADLDGA